MVMKRSKSFGSVGKGVVLAPKWNVLVLFAVF